MDRLLIVYVAIDIVNGGKFIRSKGLVSSKLFSQMYECLMGRTYEIRTQLSTQRIQSVFLRTTSFFYVLYPLCICQCSGIEPIILFYRPSTIVQTCKEIAPVILDSSHFMFVPLFHIICRDFDVYSKVKFNCKG